jgi:hypothetical protein
MTNVRSFAEPVLLTLQNIHPVHPTHFVIPDGCRPIRNLFRDLGKRISEGSAIPLS